MDLIWISLDHKKLAEENEGQFTFLGENFEKNITFSVSIEKGVTRIDKKEKKSQKSYSTDNNLLIALDLWQAHYPIFSIIFMKKHIKLNKYIGMITKKMKHVELSQASHRFLILKIDKKRGDFGEEISKNKGELRRFWEHSETFRKKLNWNYISKGHSNVHA